MEVLSEGPQPRPMSDRLSQVGAMAQRDMGPTDGGIHRDWRLPQSLHDLEGRTFSFTYPRGARSGQLRKVLVERVEMGVVHEETKIFTWDYHVSHALTYFPWIACEVVEHVSAPVGVTAATRFVALEDGLAGDSDVVDAVERRAASAPQSACERFGSVAGPRPTDTVQTGGLGSASGAGSSVAGAADRPTVESDWWMHNDRVVEVWSDSAIHEQMCRMIDRARTKVAATFFTFDNVRVQTALESAKARGCAVLVLMDRSQVQGTASREQPAATKSLIEAGVEVRTASSSDGRHVLHQKTVMADESFVLVGSANGTFNSERKCFELAIATTEPAAVGSVCRKFEELWGRGKAVTADDAASWIVRREASRSRSASGSRDRELESAHASGLATVAEDRAA